MAVIPFLGGQEFTLLRLPHVESLLVVSDLTAQCVRIGPCHMEVSSTSAWGQCLHS